MIEALLQLNAGGTYRWKLTVVGGKYAAEEEYYEAFLAHDQKLDWIDYRGKVYDLNVLVELYRAADIFVMPAKNELFGLVYIEALSQGLPIIYGKGEGIESFVKGQNVGMGVEQNNVPALKKALLEVVENYSGFTGLNKFASNFKWKKIVKTYSDIYESI